MGGASKVERTLPYINFVGGFVAAMCIVTNRMILKDSKASWQSVTDLSSRSKRYDKQECFYLKVTGFRTLETVCFVSLKLYLVHPTHLQVFSAAACNKLYYHLQILLKLLRQRMYF